MYPPLTLWRKGWPFLQSVVRSPRQTYVMLSTARSNVLLRGPVAVRDIKRSTSLTHRTDSQRNIPKAASFGNDSHHKVFAAWFCLIRIFHLPHVDLLVFCNEASVLTYEKSCCREKITATSWISITLAIVSRFKWVNRRFDGIIGILSTRWNRSWFCGFELSIGGAENYWNWSVLVQDVRNIHVIRQE